MTANPLAPRIDPVAWHPPDPPEMTGPLAPNHELRDCETVLTADGPEDVAFDPEGRLYTGDESGAVYRTVDPVDPDTVDAEIETVARTNGRPLAMAFGGEDLLVCAEDAGLLSVAPDGAVETLAASAGGRPIAFADDLHVTDDVVYFTDATEHDLFQDELFELRDTGRLLAYHRDAGETTVECGGLGFANGVVPGPDSESLLVTETARYRVTRYWTDGDHAGESETFAENLPGYPDNIDVAVEREGYWVAVPTLRDATLERLHRHPRVKWLLGVLPKAAMEAIEGDPYGLVLRLDGSGEVVESLHDPSGEVFGITSATPHEGALYLGSLFGSAVRRYALG